VQRIVRSLDEWGACLDAWSNPGAPGTVPPPNGMHVLQVLIPEGQAGLFGQQAFRSQEGNDLFGHKLMSTG
jgi:hypothetical protein